MSATSTLGRWCGAPQRGPTALSRRSPGPSRLPVPYSRGSLPLRAGARSSGARLRRGGLRRPGGRGRGRACGAPHDLLHRGPRNGEASTTTTPFFVTTNIVLITPGSRSRHHPPGPGRRTRTPGCPDPERSGTGANSVMVISFVRSIRGSWKGFRWESHSGLIAGRVNSPAASIAFPTHAWSFPVRLPEPRSDWSTFTAPSPYRGSHTGHMKHNGELGDFPRSRRARLRPEAPGWPLPAEHAGYRDCAARGSHIWPE